MLCVALVSVGAFAQKGEQRVGLNLNYGTEIANVGLGAKYQYGLTDAIRLEGGFDYFFKKDGASMWDININAHYLFPFADKFAAYPLVGLTYTNWGLDYAVGYDMDSNSSTGNMWGMDEEIASGKVHESRFGVNLGAGIQYDITDNWAANFEIKYQLIGDFGQAVFGIGAAYKF